MGGGLGGMGMGGMGGMGMGMGGLGGGGGGGGGPGGGGGDGGAPVEITPTQVEAIRRMVAENATLMGPLIEDLRTTDPEGAAGLSATDPDGILRYFNQLGNDGGHGSSGGGGGGSIGSIGAPTRVPALPPTGNAGMALTPADNASIREVIGSFLSYTVGIYLTSRFPHSWKKWVIRVMRWSKHISRAERTRNWRRIILLKVHLIDGWSEYSSGYTCDDVGW
jgi:hypothetical protein